MAISSQLSATPLGVLRFSSAVGPSFDSIGGARRRSQPRRNRVRQGS